MDPATVSVTHNKEHPERPLHPLRLLNHEVAHVEDELILLQEQNLKSTTQTAPQLPASESLEQKYNAIVIKMFDSLKNDPKFQALVTQAGAFKTKVPDPTLSAKESVDILFRNSAVSSIQKGDAPTIMGNLESAKIVSTIVKDQDLQKLIGELQLVIHQQTGGFPLYAFHNYGDETNPAFHELSSTYTEIPPEKVRREIVGGNPFVRDATQLAFDSDKITEQEYRYRMGSYCQRNQCGKCLLYTLACAK